MWKLSLLKLFTVVLALNFLMVAGCAQFPHEPASKTEIGFIDINSDIKLRRMVVHNSRPKGVVLFLHGFPETLYAWKDISSTLGRTTKFMPLTGRAMAFHRGRPSIGFPTRQGTMPEILKDYIDKSGIDTSKLVIYATDIGALPALMLALDEPHIAKQSSWVTLPRSTDRSTCIPVCKV